MKYEIGQKIKLTEDLKSISVKDYIIKKGTIIEIYSFNSLHGGRHDIVMTKLIAINENGCLHHVKINNIKGDIKK